MSNTHEISGTRHMVQRDAERYYFFISAEDIMFSGPQEGSIARQDEYSMINLTCRLISRLLAHGGTWEDVLHQIDAANVTRNRTWIADIAQVIRADKGVE